MFIMYLIQTWCLKKNIQIIPIQNKYLSKCPKCRYVPILKCKNKNDGEVLKKIKWNQIMIIAYNTA